MKLSDHYCLRKKIIKINYPFTIFKQQMWLIISSRNHIYYTLINNTHFEIDFFYGSKTRGNKYDRYSATVIYE